MPMSAALFNPSMHNLTMGIWGDKRVTYPPNMFSIMQDDCNGLDVDFRELKTIKSMDEPVLKDLNVLHSTTREVSLPFHCHPRGWFREAAPNVAWGFGLRLQ